MAFELENMAFPFVDEVDGLSKVIKKIIVLFFGVHRRAKFIDFSLHGLKNSLSFLQLSHFELPAVVCTMAVVVATMNAILSF